MYICAYICVYVSVGVCVGVCVCGCVCVGVGVGVGVGVCGFEATIKEGSGWWAWMWADEALQRGTSRRGKGAPAEAARKGGII